MYKSLAKTLFVGKNVIYLPSCHSTNDVASDLLQKDEISTGDIVITSNQTAGKGQRGNTWETEPNKNLTFSIFLKPGFLLANEQFNLNMAITIGIVNHLRIIDKDFKTKWPNDIYFQNKKIGGVLIQNNLKGRFIDSSIVGIGLNVNQSSFDVAKATSLCLLKKTSFDLPELLEGISSSIEAKYLQLKNGLKEVLKQEYLNLLLGLNEERLFKSDQTFEGRIINISPAGKLIIDTLSGIKEFDLKEVEFL